MSQEEYIPTSHPEDKILRKHGALIHRVYHHKSTFRHALAALINEHEENGVAFSDMARAMECELKNGPSPAVIVGDKGKGL